MIVNSNDMMMDVIGARLMIFVHSKVAPQDEDFLRIAEVARALDPKKVRCLVVTDGGGPTIAQRKMMTQTLNEKVKMPTAIMSTSTIVRFIVSSIALINNKAKSFDPNNIKEVFEYLDLKKEEQILVWQFLDMAERREKFSTVRLIVEQRNSRTSSTT